MSELDDLERELRAGGDIWFRDDLLVKLHRLIEIARQGEAYKKAYEKATGVIGMLPVFGVTILDDGTIRRTEFGR